MLPSEIPSSSEAAASRVAPPVRLLRPLVQPVRRSRQGAPGPGQPELKRQKKLQAATGRPTVGFKQLCADKDLCTKLYEVIKSKVVVTTREVANADEGPCECLPLTRGYRDVSASAGARRGRDLRGAPVARKCCARSPSLTRLLLPQERHRGVLVRVRVSRGLPRLAPLPGGDVQQARGHGVTELQGRRRFPCKSWSHGLARPSLRVCERERENPRVSSERAC
jgi:hypothetical protein